MIASFREVLEADTATLLCRALYSQPVVAFGDDGVGKYGRCSQPQTYTICDVDVDVEYDEDSGQDPTGLVVLTLAGYNSNQFGHVVTDQNLMIGLRKLLVAQHIDPSCLKWAPVDLQPEDGCTLFVDVPLLLDWA